MILNQFIIFELQNIIYKFVFSYINLRTQLQFHIIRFRLQNKYQWSPSPSQKLPHPSLKLFIKYRWHPSPSQMLPHPSLKLFIKYRRRPSPSQKLSFPTQIISVKRQLVFYWLNGHPPAQISPLQEDPTNRSVFQTLKELDSPLFVDCWLFTSQHDVI